MKLDKTALVVVLTVVLCIATVCPSRGAETAGEAVTTEEDAALQNEEQLSNDNIVQSDEDFIIEEPLEQEVGPLIESRPAVQSVEPQLLVRGSVSGNSEITWSSNTMPVAFDITCINLRKQAYLTPVQDGYLRVAYDGTSIVIEYYDERFHMTKQGHLSMELDKWGGFYKGEDAYYIVEGQNNKDCVDDTEVLRIIKYDFSWNRLGAGNILAQEGWEYEIRYPFDYSCVNMREVNGKLYIVTGRQGYVDELYGQGHQGMMLIRMDEETFDTEIVYGDFGHSFAQYADLYGSDLYICELSEGGRCTSLSRFDTNRTGTDYSYAFSDRFSVLGYGGERTSAWAIPCYASADDMAISSDNVFCLGTSIDQSQYDNVTSDLAHNIYLTVTPLSNLDSDHTTVKWLTDYTGSGKSFIGVYITKVNDDRFLITWEESPGTDESVSLADYQDMLSRGILHYVFVDGSGNKISEEFTASAMISDCHPVLNGSRVVYYASSANCMDFYTIDAQTGEFNKKVIRIAGDNITWDYDSGVLSFSGEGELSIDLEAAPRYPLSSTSSIYVYSSSDNCWKYLRDFVTKIRIGENILSIPERVFAFYDNLTTVYLAEGLKSIGKEAFYSCDALREISIPDSVEEIGDDIVWTGAYWTSNNAHVYRTRIIGNCTSYAIEYAKKNNISYNAQHKWNEEYVVDKEPTCAEKGSKSIHCSVCGEINKDSVQEIEKLAHTYGDWELVKEATCTEDGVLQKVCINCGDIIYNYTPAYGHSYQVSGEEDGLYTLKCDACGDEFTAAVPSSIYPYWKKAGAEGAYYWSNVPSGLEAGDTVAFLIGIDSYSAEADRKLDDITLESDDPEHCIIEKDWSWSGTIRFLEAGIYTITIYPTYNPDYKVTRRIKIVKPIESVTILADPGPPQVYGTSISLTAGVDGGKGTLYYTFASIDESGTERTIRSEAADATCIWKPSAAGTYNLRADVRDAGDDDRVVSSSLLSYTVKKAKAPSEMPPSALSVPYSTDKVSDDILQSAGVLSWSFEKASIGKALAAGKTVSFTVVYTGADKGNYETETARVKVTRSACDHNGTVTVKNAAEPTCTTEGQTGDKYCDICGELLEAGVAIPVIEHTWDSGKITTAPQIGAEGVRTFTCKACGTTRTESIPALKDIAGTSVQEMQNKTYTGKEITQTVVVWDGSQSLVEGVDYTVSYEDNINPGTATAIIKGIGSYAGEVTREFYILPGKTTRGDMFNLANNVKVTWKEVPGAKYYKVYRQGVTDPSETVAEPVIVTTGLIGWDKSPGLTNGHAYRYKIVASLTGKGDSSGDSPLSYSKLMYRLKTVVIRSVKNTAPGKVTVKYDKTTSGDSYVLQYCEREDMVGAKTKVVLGASNTSYVIGGLKKGKTYYISIRVRKKVDGIDYYTTFGVAKKVTITK